jgi:hypothetical protein
MNTAIISVDRKRRLARLLREAETIWVKGELAFAQRRGRKATVLPEEEAEGKRRRNGRKEKICPVCGVRFKAEEGQRYCSSLCAEEAGEAEVEVGEAETGEVAENHPRKPPHTGRFLAQKSEGVAEVDHLGVVEGHGGGGVTLRLTAPETMAALLQGVIEGRVMVRLEPGTTREDAEFFLGFISTDTHIEVGSFIPKFVKRLITLYSKGLLEPVAVHIWRGNKETFITGLEGRVPVRLLSLKGWSGRAWEAKPAFAEEQQMELPIKKGGEDA